MIVNSSSATMNIVSGALQAAPLVSSSLLYHQPRPFPIWTTKIGNARSISGAAAVLVKTNRQDSASTSTSAAQQQQQSDDLDLQYVSQIKRVGNSPISSSSYSTCYSLLLFNQLLQLRFWSF